MNVVLKVRVGMMWLEMKWRIIRVRGKDKSMSCSKAVLAMLKS